MNQRHTSKRLGRRANFRSLLMAGLLAGGSCAPLANLSAQAPDRCAPQTEAAHAPRQVVQLLGLKPRGVGAVAQFSPLATPPKFDLPQVPQASAVVQVQYQSAPKRAGQTNVPATEAAPEAAAASGVAHAYLTESSTNILRGPRGARVQPLSTASVEAAIEPTESASDQSPSIPAPSIPAPSIPAPSIPAPSNGSPVASDPVASDPVISAPVFNAPVFSAPVQFDAATAATAGDDPTEPPEEETESLLDLDLSSLTAQGPTAASLAPGGGSSGSGAVSIVEETPPKLIGTEPGALGKARPITRATQLSLSDTDSEDRAAKSPSVRGQVASQVSKPTRVNVHETFAPRPANSGQSFHLSDDDAPRTVAAKPVKLSTQNRLVAPSTPSAPAQPVAQQKVAGDDMPVAIAAPLALPTLPHAPTPKLVGEAGPVETAVTAEALPAIEDTVVSAVQPAPALVLAPPPALLPPTPALLGMPEPATGAVKPPSSTALTAPFEPGSEGMVVKASRPGLRQQGSQPEPMPEPATRVAATPQLESRTAQLASSSSNRPVSLRVGGSAPAALPAGAPTAEQRPRSETNPIAFPGPVVRAVKQVATTEPIAKPIAKPVDKVVAALETTSQSESSGQSQMVQDLMNNIKKSFPNSRVELKTDEEGLVAEGVAASESEAKKILAMVRTTALCPVADRIITKR